MPVSTKSPSADIALFVQNIWVFDEPGNPGRIGLPFFADGYAGLIFFDSPGGMYVTPQHKPMPPLFLHGQTIVPIELEMNGPYKIIAFQLYPFVLSSFFQLDPKQLNDDCYDLTGKTGSTGEKLVDLLAAEPDASRQIAIISDWLYAVFREKQQHIDQSMVTAIRQIVAAQGQVVIKDIAAQVHLTERTFERRFLTTAGVSAKQFAKIIQFSQSLEQLNSRDFTRLTDIVYANGFADQSHFIKVFKAFTGRTPKAFL